MGDHKNLTAAAIGHCAHEILQTETCASVWGNTSKGLFAVTENKKVLFISRQKYKGPLTVNLNENSPALKSIDRRTHILLSPDQISFNQSDLKIRISPETRVWTPAILIMTDLDLDVFTHRSELIECEMIKQISSQKLDLTSRVDENVPMRDQVHEDQINITDTLISAFCAQDNATVYVSLSNLIGLGKGLTPTGDDFICGFMLACYAWKEFLIPGFGLQKTIKKIVEEARVRTTAISANLIACAASGSADERIIDSLSWLTNGGLPITIIMEELLTYGSSSGLDTLAGMLAFIQASPNVH